MTKTNLNMPDHNDPNRCRAYSVHGNAESHEGGTYYSYTVQLAMLRPVAWALATLLAVLAIDVAQGWFR